MSLRRLAAVMTFVIAAMLSQRVPAESTSHASQTRSEAEPLLSGAEYPPQDGQILSLLRRGVETKAASRRLKDVPDSVETIRLLANQERIDEMLPALQLLVRNHPDRIAEAFAALQANMHRVERDPSRGYITRLEQIVSDARKRLPGLTAESAARAERVLLEFDGYFLPPTGNRDVYTQQLKQFIETYSGTEAALLTEVDVLTRAGVSPAQLAALDEFARAHPGTVAAAKATHARGFNLAVNMTRYEKPGGDPTERFMQVLAISRDLETGAYPPCEWVDRAPSIVTSFFAYKPTYASENLPRLLSASYDFVKTHFTLADNPGDSSIGYFIIGKLPELTKAQGDEIGGMEQLFARLERDIPDPSAVRYLRAQYYLRRMRESPSERGPMLQRAIAALSELQGQGRGLYHRKALAALGAQRFAERDFPNARADLLKYVQEYPESNWAWVAALRAALCDEELGDMKAASSSNLSVASTYESNPVALVLARAYAARAYEGQSRFDLALAEDQHALKSWDDDYGPSYSLFLRRPPRPTDEFNAGDGTLIVKQTLPPRIAQLKQSLARSGGDVLEHGRFLLDRQQREEAIATLKPLLTNRRSAAVAADARYLMHRAQFEIALDAADADRPSNEAGATAALENLSREPLDFAVTAAKIAQASIRWKRGDAGAEASMRLALDEWHAQQRMTKPADPLAQDVADIQRILFLPTGGSVFGAGRWNAFDWPSVAPPFAIVNPDVRVKLATNEIVQVAVKQPLSINAKVLFFGDEELALLRATMVRLGGNQRRVPTGVMETPNQPVGASMNILELWRRHFPARPGHWGGWVLETYPIITEIAFVNAARTQAAVAVTIGYSGGTVIMEKERGVWIAKRFTNQWIT